MPEYAEREETGTVSIDVRIIHSFGSVFHIPATRPIPLRTSRNCYTPHSTYIFVFYCPGLSVFTTNRTSFYSHLNSIALAFAYIERILASEDLSLAVMTAISTLDSTLPMLDAAGFEKIVYEDFYDVFVGLIRSIGEPDANGKVLTPEGLLEAFQDSEGM